MAHLILLMDESDVDDLFYFLYKVNSLITLFFSTLVLVIDPIFEQTDGTYTHTIESLVHRVCKLARESGEDHQRRCLRPSSLQRLSTMVVLWFECLKLLRTVLFFSWNNVNFMVSTFARCNSWQNFHIFLLILTRLVLSSFILQNVSMKLVLVYMNFLELFKCVSCWASPFIIKYQGKPATPLSH